MENRTLDDWLVDFQANLFNGNLQAIVRDMPWTDHEVIDMPPHPETGATASLHFGRFGASMAAWSVGFDEDNVVLHQHDDINAAAACFQHKVEASREMIEARLNGRSSLPPQLQAMLDMLRQAGGPGVDVQVMEIDAPQRRRPDQPMIGRAPSNDDGEHRPGMYL